MFVDRINGKVTGCYTAAQYGGQEELPDDSTEIANFNNPPITPEQVKESIKAQIVSLEASQYMTRGEREGWLALMVSTAAAQHLTEPQLYAANPFYKHTKDLNDQIVALRAQL